MRNFVSLRGFIRSFRRSQGDFAACGRRVSFPAMGKKPMAQATLSCPFGAIHLEDRRGTAQDGHFVSIFAHPTPSVASRHLPLTGGVGPRSPITGVTPWTRQKISGAQNLSECPNSRRTTGPWVCKNCGWCGSTSAPGFAKPTLPVRILAGRSGTGPYENNAVASISAVGAGPRPARKPSPSKGEGRFPLSGGNVPEGQKG